jgi:hypothetical protein
MVPSKPIEERVTCSKLRIEGVSSAPLFRERAVARIGRTIGERITLERKQRSSNAAY